MRFHFLGFLKNDGSFFGGGHHIKKVSQNDGNGPMRSYARVRRPVFALKKKRKWLIIAHCLFPRFFRPSPPPSGAQPATSLSCCLAGRLAAAPLGRS